jgi:hypothetical protein
VSLVLLPSSARSRLGRPSWLRGGGASTSQGHPRTVFRRALDRGNLLAAEATAKEIGRLSLSEALELTLLIARKEPCRHPRGSRCSAERSFNRLLREGAGRKSRQKYGPTAWLSHVR